MAQKTLKKTWSKNLENGQKNSVDTLQSLSFPDKIERFVERISRISLRTRRIPLEQSVVLAEKKLGYR